MGKDNFLTLSSMTNEAMCAWKAYRRRDPVMMRHTCSMRDTLYRKSAPNRELWHTEMSFDYSFCVLAAAGIVVVIATLAMLRRICRAMFCRRRRKR